MLRELLYFASNHFSKYIFCWGLFREECEFFLQRAIHDLCHVCHHFYLGPNLIILGRFFDFLSNTIIDDLIFRFCSKRSPATSYTRNLEVDGCPSKEKL